MDSPFLHYVQYLMVVGGIFPVGLINSHKRIYILYRHLTHAILFLFLFCLFGGNKDFHGSKEVLFKYINDRIIVIVIYINLVTSMSENFDKLIFEMIAYEAEVADVGTEKHLKINEQIVTKTRRVQVFYILNILVCYVALFVPAFIEYAVVQASEKSNNITINTYTATPYDFWVPFDESKHYLALLLIQAYYLALMAVSIYCPFQIILINLFLTVILRLKMLRANIESMRDFDTLDVNKFIRIYVKEHIDIMRNCRFLNDTMKYAMLLEFLITSGELSMFIFIVIMTSSPNSKMFSGACIVNLLVKILILCWHADQIREESIGIADAVYELPWLEYDKSDVTSLQIIMMRSQKPLTLTIGPFGTMTLELAVKIFKATYTYVTFMQNVYGKLD